MDKDFKSGFIVIAGKPNVGKSTLLNALLNRKIAIVSEKPETTRDSIRGVLTDSRSQLIFTDTPGIHRPHLLLGRLMVTKASSALQEADLVLLILEVSSGLTAEDRMIIDMIRQANKPAIAVINKIDKMSKSKILPMIDELKDDYDFLDFIPISALKEDNIILLKSKILENMSTGEKYYPDDYITDKDDKAQAADIIREKALGLTRQEVPHSIAVLVDKISRREDSGIIDIEAVIFVERDSQKGIIVGRKGEMIKSIGTLSRQELEEKYEAKVFLQLWVRVLKNWRKDPKALKALGIG